MQKESPFCLGETAISGLLFVGNHREEERNSEESCVKGWGCCASCMTPPSFKVYAFLRYHLSSNSPDKDVSSFAPFAPASYIMFFYGDDKECICLQYLLNNCGDDGKVRLSGIAETPKFVYWDNYFLQSA